MFKQFGAIYLILGTCVAAGMLGLPVAAAPTHFSLSCIQLFIAWSLMTIGAWALLKVNLALPAGSSLVSMTEHTLGKFFKYITWFSTLMLLYTLICAYLAASGDLLHTFLNYLHLPAPLWVGTVLATVILGSIVYAGIGSVDWVNRLLMSVKIAICFVVIASILPAAHMSYLHNGSFKWNTAAFWVMITSFGYSVVLPSIRVYLNSDKKALYRVLTIGSILPLILYVLWMATIQGVVTRTGAHGLLAMNGVANTVSLLMGELSRIAHNHILSTLSVAFVSICSITGFLGVSLSLMDMLADGFKQSREGLAHVLLALVTYVPPMLIVIFRPQLFIHALAYAGMLCVYVLIILPILMWLGLKFKRA